MTRDIAFCVDLTNMSPFIEAARAQVSRILDDLRTAPDVDLRVAFVGYRDVGKLPKGFELAIGTGGAHHVARTGAAAMSSSSSSHASRLVNTGLMRLRQRGRLESHWKCGPETIRRTTKDARVSNDELLVRISGSCRYQALAGHLIHP